MMEQAQKKRPPGEAALNFRDEHLGEYALHIT
jgi:hypothetical protein